MTCARNHSSMSIADAKYGNLPGSVKTNRRQTGDSGEIYRGNGARWLGNLEKVRRLAVLEA